jgi:flagellar motility protein MotE (MotC chaperone)
MSDQEIEKTLMVIESEILTLNLENAQQLASSMKLEESKVKDKSIFSVIKVIRQEIEEKVGNLPDQEAVIEHLNGINAFLGPPPLEPAESKEVSQEEKEIVDLEQQIKQLMSKKKEIKAKLGETETCKEAEVVEVLPGVLKVPVAAFEKSFLHREFKVQGVVGEPGQKDKLGYQSLISQISRRRS